MENKRISERIKLSKQLKVYTSIVNIPYTVKLENISATGAFVKTPFLPKENEIITVEAFDASLATVYRGNASVKWIRNSETPTERGFGIEFSQNFPVGLVEQII